MRKTYRLSACALFLSIAILGVSQGSAAANYVYEKVNTYQSDTNCTSGRSETSHGANNNGYFKADTTSRYNFFTVWGPINCGKDWNRSAGQIATKIDIYKWDGYQWLLCAATDWLYNGGVQAFDSYYVNSGYLFCGVGYYGTIANGYVWNNAWYGGGVWSGYHYLPA